MKLSVLVLPI